MATMIEVENLGKRYRLGGRDKYYKTLRESLVRGLLSPFARLGGAREKSTEEFWALRNVSFSVDEGEVVGIIGRNGAGKSTLLKLLSRITRPTEGQARLYGRVGSLLEVGTGFHPELTGRENIFLSGTLLGMTRAEVRAKFDEIVEFAGVETFLDTPAKHYSSGMYVRLGFAIAAHLEPEILLVDEVLAVGDMAFQKKCLGKMGEVARSGRTVLFVSHNMAAVQSLCPRALLISDGAVAMQEQTGHVVASYMTSSLQSSPQRHGLSTGQTGPSRHFQFEFLQMENDAGVASNTHEFGGSAIFRLTIRCLKPVEDGVVGIRISNLQGTTLHFLTSDWEGEPLRLSSGVYTLHVLWSEILLFPGRYTAGLFAGRAGTFSDALHWDTLEFEVKNAPRGGKVLPMESYGKSQCETYSKSVWRVL